ncbi:MAG: hypothetical protein WBD56_03785, partial [Anaerolineales bacterium]
ILGVIHSSKVASRVGVVDGEDAGVGGEVARMLRYHSGRGRRGDWRRCRWKRGRRDGGRTARPS